MGHLINPVAFRLGFFKSWEDVWFVKNIYYPEFLNGMLKLRNYLYYVLTNKNFLRSGIFLSNFFILKYNKLYIINIYVYHIDYEKLSFRSINNLYSSFLNYGRNFKKKKPNSFFELFWKNIDLFFFLICFYKFFKKKKKRRRKINLYINSNLFYKSYDLKFFHRDLMNRFNNTLFNKFINKEKRTFEEFKKQECPSWPRTLEGEKSLFYWRIKNKLLEKDKFLYILYEKLKYKLWIARYKKLNINKIFRKKQIKWLSYSDIEGRNFHLLYKSRDKTNRLRLINGYRMLFFQKILNVVNFFFKYLNIRKKNIIEKRKKFSFFNNYIYRYMNRFFKTFKIYGNILLFKSSLHPNLYYVLKINLNNKLWNYIRININQKKIINEVSNYILLKLNIFKHDFMYFKEICIYKFRNKFLNKFINKEINIFLKERKEKLELIYKYNIKDFYFKKKRNFKRLFFSNFKMIYLRFDRKFLSTNFSFIEYIMFLFKKVKYFYKNSILDKLIKIRYVIFFLKLTKYMNFKVNKNYNFFLFFLVSWLKSKVQSFFFNKKFRMKKKIYFLLYESLGYRFFFKQLKVIMLFLKNIFFFINKIKNICFKFYFLSNKSITARWLSRYIGMKLKNNYNFYSILNPVKRELYKLCKLNKKFNRNFKSIKFFNLIKNNNKKYKSNFINLIKNFSLIHIKEFFLFYINNKTFMTAYFSHSFYDKMMPWQIIRYGEYYLYKLGHFLKLYKFLYTNIFANYYLQLNVLSKNKIMENIINIFYNLPFLQFDNKLFFDLNKLFISTFFIKNLINFNYFKYIWLQIKTFNTREFRSKNLKCNKSFLLGFKLAFKGRFSRKQRASNIWFMRGKVPLNTVSLKLDYSFFTIALKNSAISIKIILYKNSYKENYKYLLIY